MSKSEEKGNERFDLVAGPATGRDMQYIRQHRLNPFIRDGRVDIDAYLQFVTEFNEFINHAPKPFRPILDKDMRL